MITALIPQLLPLVSSVLDKTIPDKGAKDRALQDIEKNLVDNAANISLETIKTNQIEAGSRHWFVASWRPAIGWSCALGIFWVFIGFPVSQWGVAMAGVDVAMPEIKTDILLELTLAMLGMSGLRTFEKLKGISK